ncbi:Hypothetical protein PHPALM_8587 [Phytophthora palmivora]|uniref:Uncharacterized protein n=1 Tax=Phytophthora palmivora TaxID=4796 RepID=A0A2P4Y9G8_9STRA|nr:Hypothetical protein PHPALM_8587 [Phytophthora palmivora]
MLKAHKSVNNQKPGLIAPNPVRLVLDAYEAENYVHYRVRTSEKRDKYDRMWCTHTASQPSRGAGRLDTDSTFTGCEASFAIRSVTVVEDGTATWKVRIDAETEISLHNHKTTKAIYESYSGPTSSTLSHNVRHNLGLLTEMKTSTADINRSLADKIDIAITPQQTRNFVRHILGSTTLERTKALLDTFADEQGITSYLSRIKWISRASSRCRQPFKKLVSSNGVTHS